MTMATGKRIRTYRQRLGWTLEELEEVSEVPSGTISALELRDSKKSQFFPALARAFGLTLEQLYDESREWPLIPPVMPSAYAAAPIVPLAAKEKSGPTRDYYTKEAMDILAKMPDSDLRGAVAALKTHVQNMGPPRNGQTVSVAG